MDIYQKIADLAARLAALERRSALIDLPDASFADRDMYSITQTGPDTWEVVFDLDVLHTGLESGRPESEYVRVAKTWQFGVPTDVEFPTIEFICVPCVSRVYVGDVTDGGFRWVGRAGGVPLEPSRFTADSNTLADGRRTYAAFGTRQQLGVLRWNGTTWARATSPPSGIPDLIIERGRHLATRIEYNESTRMLTVHHVLRETASQGWSPQSLSSEMSVEIPAGANWGLVYIGADAPGGIIMDIEYQAEATPSLYGAIQVCSISTEDDGKLKELVDYGSMLQAPLAAATGSLSYLDHAMNPQTATIVNGRITEIS